MLPHLNSSAMHLRMPNLVAVTRHGGCRSFWPSPKPVCRKFCGVSDSVRSRRCSDCIGVCRRRSSLARNFERWERHWDDHP